MLPHIRPAGEVQRHCRHAGASELVARVEHRDAPGQPPHPVRGRARVEGVAQRRVRVPGEPLYGRAEATTRPPRPVAGSKERLQLEKPPVTRLPPTLKPAMFT